MHITCALDGETIPDCVCTLDVHNTRKPAPAGAYDADGSLTLTMEQATMRAIETLSLDQSDREYAAEVLMLLGGAA
jgi:hypothetical protein